MNGAKPNEPNDGKAAPNDAVGSYNSTNMSYKC